MMNVKKALQALLIALLYSGCAGDGYITSGVSTVLGLDVSENPKTQVPHIRFGYVRAGMYYVPTGKTIGKGGINSAGRADETPDVVSEIFVHTKFLTDVTISEKFAIGKAAVDSSAAATSFANPSAQQVASGTSAVTGTEVVRTVTVPQRRVVREVDDPTATTMTAAAREEASVRELKGKITQVRRRVPAEERNKPDFYERALAAGGFENVQGATEATYLEKVDTLRNRNQLEGLLRFFESQAQR